VIGMQRLRPSERGIVNEMKSKCVTCGREVEPEIISYGKGYVGTCPVCGGVAYNEKEKPEEE